MKRYKCINKPPRRSRSGPGTRCQFELSGNSGPCGDVTCVCACVSVPLKHSSAQHDPCLSARVCLCVCVCVKAEEKRSCALRDTESRASGAVAAVRRNKNTEYREEGACRGHLRGSPAVSRLRFHGCFERKRQRLTGITGLSLPSSQPAGREFLCRLGALKLRIKTTEQKRQWS